MNAVLPLAIGALNLGDFGGLVARFAPLSGLLDFASPLLGNGELRFDVRHG